MRVLAATMLIATAAGCLPRGEAPRGTQLLSGRSALLTGLVPPNGDGLLRILLMRPGSTSALANLSVFSLDADNNPSPEVLLVPDIDPVFSVSCSGGLAPCTFDAQGRIEVESKTDGQLVVDPVSGEIQPVPPFGRPQPPPLGQRGYVYQTQTSGTLYDADGHATPIELASPAPTVFVSLYELLPDGDFYYVDPQYNLIEIPPTGGPEQVATGVTYFAFWDTDNGPLLALERMTADGSGTQSLVGDPRSSTATVVPFGVTQATVSPDGRWVLDTEDQMYGQFSFFDRTSGALQGADVGQPANFANWRPGTSEAWVMGFAPNYRDAGTVWVLRPDAPAVSVPDIDIQGGYGGESFTPDGVYWYAVTPTTDSGTNIFEIGVADDPTGPRFSLNPPATQLSGFWYLPNGRFLSSNYVKDYHRSDARLLDPRTGEDRLLAERGTVIAVGQTRFMGIFHLEELRGDLVVGGFEDASPTKLAAEFAEGAFAEPQGADLLAPGTRIIYQFQARAASPYDGIWMVNCP